MQIFPDGMTATTGDTPSFRLNGRTSKEDKGKPCIESRIIGVRVVCGPVDELFIYYTDNFGSSGANTMCEVARQSMSDLAIILKEKHNFRLPRKGYFQFGNCSENKASGTMHFFRFGLCLYLLNRMGLSTAISANSLNKGFWI
jgi:hypothetical protein